MKEQASYKKILHKLCCYFCSSNDSHNDIHNIYESWAYEQQSQESSTADEESEMSSHTPIISRAESQPLPTLPSEQPKHVLAYFLNDEDASEAEDHESYGNSS